MWGTGQWTQYTQHPPRGSLEHMNVVIPNERETPGWARPTAKFPPWGRGSDPPIPASTRFGASFGASRKTIHATVAPIARRNCGSTCTGKRDEG